MARHPRRNLYFVLILYRFDHKTRRRQFVRGSTVKLHGWTPLEIARILVKAFQSAGGISYAKGEKIE